MDLGLEGRVAWVTGASAGLGRASALALAREGAHVAVSARRADALDEVVAAAEADGGRCVAVPVDVTDGDSVSEAATAVTKRLGPISILVGNAGGPPPGTFETTSEGTLRDAYELVTVAAWRLIEAVVPSMEERGQGCITFITSWGTKEPIPGLLPSNAVRPAVVGLVKTLATELGPRGIRLLCVAPGRIDTDRLRSVDAATAQRQGASAEEVAEASRARIPLRRYGTPEEFGRVVAFLSSDAASYVTGVTVAVDGGILSGLLS